MDYDESEKENVLEHSYSKKRKPTSSQILKVSWNFTVFYTEEQKYAEVQITPWKSYRLFLNILLYLREFLENHWKFLCSQTDLVRSQIKGSEMAGKWPSRYANCGA